MGLLGRHGPGQAPANVAESALAELNEVAKVEYINQIKQIPSGKNAELALFRRQPDGQSAFSSGLPPLIYRAIR